MDGKQKLCRLPHRKCLLWIFSGSLQAEAFWVTFVVELISFILPGVVKKYHNLNKGIL